MLKSRQIDERLAGVDEALDWVDGPKQLHSTGQRFCQYFPLDTVNGPTAAALAAVCIDAVHRLAREIEALGCFEIHDVGDSPGYAPALSWGIAADAEAGFDLQTLTAMLRLRGWALHVQPGGTVVQWMVIRPGAIRDVTALFAADLRRAMRRLAVDRIGSRL